MKLETESLLCGAILRDLGPPFGPLGRIRQAIKSPNGHIHQLAQRVERNRTFHAALSMAFRQPARGSRSLPGPMLVPPTGFAPSFEATIMQRNKPRRR